MSDPSPLRYLSYRSYLRSWFEHRNRRPSMNKFARDVGCSRQLVSLVCQGKRNLGEERAPSWADRMKLENLERSYFLALVQAEEGGTAEARRQGLGSVQAIRAFQEGQSDLELLTGLFAHWLRPVIHEMALCVEFEPDVAWIRSRLGPAATDEDIRDALDWLTSNGLLGPDGQKAVNAAFATAQDATSGVLTHALANHHNELLDLAYEQLPTIPPMQRSYVNITAAISSDQLHRLRTELQDFQRRMYAIAGSEPADEAGRNQVYALSMQLFPLTKVRRDPAS